MLKWEIGIQKVRFCEKQWTLEFKFSGIFCGKTLTFEKNFDTNVDKNFDKNVDKNFGTTFDTNFGTNFDITVDKNSDENVNKNFD